MLRALLLLTLLGGLNSLHAQDVSGFWDEINQRIRDRDFVRLNGAINANLGLNAISGIPQRQQNFSWATSASINLDVMGVKAPFSAAFSNGNEVYRLPSYSFYGLSPTYKWITLHGGDRSMNLSPYTFAGTSFRGGGIELKPGKFTFSAFHGRLRRASMADLGAIQNIEARYQRMGTGAKFGYTGSTTSVTFSGFYGRDIEASLDINSIDTIDLPEENLALSLELNQKISSALSFKAILAKTALTRDRRRDSIPELDDPGLGQRMFGLYQPLITTGFHNAYEFGINFQPKIIQFGISYKRVDPGYRTLGALYFQNDLENFTGQVAFPFGGDKYQLALNAGVQRNNLSSLNSSDFTRIIGSANLSATLSERLSTQLSFSNFNTTNRQRALTNTQSMIDSVIIVQTNLTLGLSTTYQLGQDKNHIFTTNFSWQNANAIQNDEVDANQNTRFLLAMLNYSYRPKESKSSFTAGILVNRNELPTGNITTTGPNLNYSRPIFNEKMTLNTTANYSRVTSSLTEPSSVFRLGATTSLQLGKAQSVSLRLAYLKNNSDVNEFQEFQLGLSYGLSFAALGKKKEQLR